jgi:hypothetical protein
VVEVTVLLPKFRALSLRSAPIAFAKLFAQLAPVLRHLRSIASHVSIIGAAVCVIASHVAIRSPITIFRYQRAGAQDSHQNYAYCSAFHNCFLLVSGLPAGLPVETRGRPRVAVIKKGRRNNELQSVCRTS